MYCTHCGAKLDDEAVYCQHCGHNTRENNPNEWSNISDALAAGSLNFANIVICILGAGMSIACAASGCGALFAGCYMLYFFASGSTLIIPAILSNIIPFISIQGAGLLFGGITSLLVAVIFAFIIFGIIKSINSVSNIIKHPHC